MPHLLTNRPLTLPVGKKVGPEELPFILNEPCLSRHLAVFGGSGWGKSKFLELLCRLLLDNYRGFCLIDPHGDLSEDILAYQLRRLRNTSPTQCASVSIIWSPPLRQFSDWTPLSPALTIRT